MSSAPHSASLRRRDIFLLAAYGVATVLVYVCLHGIYRPDNLDDAWFLSCAHNHVVNGIERDVVFATVPGVNGYGGVMLFGKSFTWLYGTVLRVVGWTKCAAHLLSTLWVVCGAACWGAILVKLGFTRRLALFLGAALLLVEPCFGAANQARPDALSWLLVSGAFLAFLCRRCFWAGLLAAVAIEIHPVGLAAFLYMASAVVARALGRGQGKPMPLADFLWLCAGVGAGFAYYLALHASSLGLLPQILGQGNASDGAWSNFLFSYFFKTKYYRHLFELVAILLCAGFLVWRRQGREQPFVLVFFGAALLFSLIIRRPSFMYVVYVYPAFLLLLFWTFERQGRLGLAACLLLVFLLPQYAFVWSRNHDWDMDAYLAQVRALVPQDDSPVVGRPNDWFAFPERTFYADCYQGDFSAHAPPSFVLIAGDTFRHGGYGAFKPAIRHQYTMAELGRFQSRGETVVIYQLTK
ncbi:MAG: hypothetical protein IJT88_03380 [Kiritimatiellae bacterium]|nr:hypothetical protein [Kiritimatiellia bacterium]